MYRSTAQKARRREGDKIRHGLHIGQNLLDQLKLNLRKLSRGAASTRGALQPASTSTRARSVTSLIAFLTRPSPCRNAFVAHGCRGGRLASAASSWAMHASKFSQDATLRTELGTVLAICRVRLTIACSGGDSCARCRCCRCDCGGWNTRVANNRTSLAKVSSKYSV